MGYVMGNNDLDPQDGMAERVPLHRNRLFHRIGCGLALVFWVALLLLPCAVIALIAQGEISVQMGDLPGQSVRIWLIQDANEWGIGITKPTIITRDQNSSCLQTDTSYILWAGSGLPASSCECFVRQADMWVHRSLSQGICRP